MSAAGNAKAKEDSYASGAKPRPEGPVREHGRRPTTWRMEFSIDVMEPARRRANPCARLRICPLLFRRKGGA